MLRNEIGLERDIGQKDYVFFLRDADFVDFVSSYLQIESGVNILTERPPFYKLRVTKQKLQQK